MGGKYGVTYPSLLQGVSQQDRRARFNTQSEEMVNFMTDVAHGTYLRSKEDVVVDLGYADDPTVVAFEKGDRTYFLIVANTMTQLVDDTGAIFPVTETNGTEVAYLKGAVEADLSVVKAGEDYLIGNRTKTVTTTTEQVTLTDQYVSNGFLWIQTVAYNTTYEATVNLRKLSDNSTLSVSAGFDIGSDNSNGHCNAITAATSLGTDIGTQLPAGVVATTVDSVVVFQSSDYEITSVVCSDSQTGDYIRYGKSVDDVSELPPHYTDDAVLTVNPLKGEEGYNSYFRFDSVTKTWTECYMYGSKQEITGTGVVGNLVKPVQDNLPVVASITLTNGIVSGATLSHIALQEPQSGDENSNPPPSFFDKQLRAISSFKDRIVFATEDSYYLSEVGTGYNFYRTTTVNALDDDPIAVTINQRSGVDIQDLIPLTDKLFIKGRYSQLYLNDNGSLTSSTLSNEVISYVRSSDSKCMVLADHLFYTSETNGKSVIYSHFTGQNGKDTPVIVNKHCSSYIDGEMTLNAVNEPNGILFMGETGSTDIYLNVVSFKDNEKKQNSFSKWVLPCQAHSLYSDKDYLYVIGLDMTATVPSMKLYKIRLMYETDVVKADGGVITFTTPSVKDANGRPRADKKFRIKKGTLSYADTKGFDLTIKRQGRDDVVYSVRHTDPTTCSLVFYVQGDDVYTTMELTSVDGSNVNILSMSFEGYEHV